MITIRFTAEFSRSQRFVLSSAESDALLRELFDITDSRFVRQIRDSLCAQLPTNLSTMAGGITRADLRDALALIPGHRW